jgi:hypothetical protein
LLECSGPYWCENPKRAAWAVPPGLPGHAVRARREPIDTLRRQRPWPQGLRSAKRVRGGRAESRPRPSSASPRRAKPKGASGGWRANHTPATKGLSEGSKPRNRGLSGRPAARAVGRTAGETVCGSASAETLRAPFERGKLRRVNPMSAAGVKQNRHGIEGRKPSRG